MLTAFLDDFLFRQELRWDVATFFECQESKLLSYSLILFTQSLKISQKCLISKSKIQFLLIFKYLNFRAKISQTLMLRKSTPKVRTRKAEEIEFSMLKFKWDFFDEFSNTVYVLKIGVADFLDFFPSRFTYWHMKAAVFLRLRDDLKHTNH